MKKLLLTLLLLFSVGMVAMAVTEELTTTLLSGNGTAYADARTYTSTTSGLSYKMGAAINSGKFQQNKSKGCFFEVTANTKGVKITNIQLVGLSSKTASYFKAKASDSHLTVNVASAGKGTGSITGGTAVALNGDSFAPNNTFFSYYVTSSASMFTFSKIIVTYEDAAPAEKIELEDAKLEVKAGEQVLGSKAELDANTTISWNYNYNGEVANPDITYSYSVDGGEDVKGNTYTFTGENDVELTVKATSENTVIKTVKLLKKYPTKCPDPVFNVEDGAKVYADQAVTVSCEGAEIEWTVNGETITGTSYTITEEVGTQLKFKATASIKGRNPETGNVEILKAEKEITVTVDEAKEVLFNFVGEENYGLTPQSGNKATYENLLENGLSEISNGIVSIAFADGNYRYWNTDHTLRVYSGCKMTISVPDNYYITSIAMTGDYLDKIGGDKEFVNTDITINSKEYTYSESSKSTNIETITVKFAKVPDPELDGEPKIIVKHGTLGGVLNVKYTFSVANFVAEKHDVKVEIIVEGHDLTFEEVKHEASAAPARANSNSTVFTKEMKATNVSLKGIATPAVTVRATLNGTELFSKAPEAKDITTTGIEDVTVEGEGEAEYFNLQGLRVAQPEAGQLYIKRQGGKAVKVRF